MATEDPPSSGVEDPSATCEGSGVNLLCAGSCGRSFHDTSAGIASSTDSSAVKEWRCGHCEKIAVSVCSYPLRTKARECVHARHRSCTPERSDGFKGGDDFRKFYKPVASRSKDPPFPGLILLTLDAPKTCKMTSSRRFQWAATTTRMEHRSLCSFCGISRLSVVMLLCWCLFCIECLFWV